MFHGAVRLAALAAVSAFAAMGLALALTGVGLPYLLASGLAALAAGGVQWLAARRQPEPDRSLEASMAAKLDDYRAVTAALRHDLRGVMSPALMMSDRLLNHQDPAVQRAGNAVVRSIERATALLAEHRESLATREGAADPAP